jgi:hypothetical protein
MPLKRKSGASFVSVANLKRRSGGAWVAVASLKRRVAGAWVAISEAILVAISDDSVFSSGATGTRVAGIRYQSDGTIQKRNGVVGTAAYVATGSSWLVAGAAVEYSLRATLTGGTAPTSGTLNTWSPLNTGRAYENQNGAIGTTVSSTLLIEIRNTATTEVLDSCTITLDAERD